MQAHSLLVPLKTFSAPGSLLQEPGLSSQPAAEGEEQSPRVKDESRWKQRVF